MGVDSRIERILEALAQSPSPGVTVQQLARDVNLSVSRLRHLFKRETGVPLGRSLKAAQMESVKTLLVSSFLSVKEVMKQAGFAQADETSFIREFKKMVGLTPGQFRLRSRAAQRRRRSKEHL